jgi:hypothetical protein
MTRKEKQKSMCSSIMLATRGLQFGPETDDRDRAEETGYNNHLVVLGRRPVGLFGMDSVNTTIR